MTCFDCDSSVTYLFGRIVLSVVVLVFIVGGIFLSVFRKFFMSIIGVFVFFVWLNFVFFLMCFVNEYDVVAVTRFFNSASL